MTVLTIASSPSASSRSARLLGRVRDSLHAAGVPSQHLELRNLPAQALLHADTSNAEIAVAVEAVRQADAIVIATPIYKAAYSGLLKVFLDLLPQDGLRGKLVLPVASGGSLAHALAIDYALRPVLHSLSAHNVLPGVFAVDKEIDTAPDGTLALAPALLERLSARIADLSEQLSPAIPERLPQAA